MKNISISKYSIFIIIIYLILMPALYVLFPGFFNYYLTGDNLKEVVLVLIFSVLLFSYFFGITLRQKFHPNMPRLAFAILYGLLIAFPEELIFRGVILSSLQNYHATGVAILLSALIFGIAHLPNGARGIRPSKWNWKLCALALMAGLPLASLYTLTGSLLLPTLLHAFFLVPLKVSVWNKN